MIARQGMWIHRTSQNRPFSGVWGSATAEFRSIHKPIHTRSNRRSQQPYVPPKPAHPYAGAEGYYVFVPAESSGFLLWAREPVPN